MNVFIQLFHRLIKIFFFVQKQILLFIIKDDKSDFINSIRVFRTLLTHKELDKESIRPYIHHLLIKISSDEFELLSVSNTISIYKLINDILT